MELKDTIPMMNNADYKERFKAEYYQLVIRKEKLKAMLEKYKAGTLPFTPNCSYELLYEQVVYMKQYQRILEERARIESVDLKEE
jgi:hypothetical protein